MDWLTIIGKCRRIGEEFDKSYKCLNTDRPTKEDTINKHIKNLFVHLEEIRVILDTHFYRLTTAHQSAAEAYFLDLRRKLINVTTRRGIEVKLSENLHENIDIFVSDLVPSPTKRLTDPIGVELKENLPEKVDETISNFVPIPTGQQSTTIEVALSPTLQGDNMTQSVVDFLKTATSLIPDFDGKSENLRSFLDALELVDSIKETHETVAISLVKTKLKGSARNLISNESSLAQIINTLKNSVKGESVEVLIAKLMNLRQKNKTANDYTKEIEDLTKALEGAYISDGLANNLASKYSTQQAIKAMTKNCSNDKVKLIMEAGTFNTMNDAISKFVNSCTEATGNANTVLYYKRRGNGNFRGANRGRNRGRGGYHYDNRNRGQRGDNYNYGRGRGNHYNGNRGVHNRRTENNRNVRITQSENDQTPLSPRE